jgi:toxin YoeB
MNVLFSNEGWEDYQYWQANDIKLLKKINDIIKDIKRNSNQGIGQPEKLKGNMSGWMSRRINLEHRIVYRIDSDAIVIIQCRYHYKS